MTFDIRGETFEITFVNNYVRERYNDMLQLVDELSDLPDEVDQVKSEDKAETKRGLKEIRKRQRQLVRQIAEVRHEMLEELLTTNGYEFDRTWWQRKTDADDINNFVFDCLQKDVNSETATSKKK